MLLSTGGVVLSKENAVSVVQFAKAYSPTLVTLDGTFIVAPSLEQPIKAKSGTAETKLEITSEVNPEQS
jgi:hypothetical protein